MSKFLNNKDRQNRAEFDKLLARCVRVVESQPNLATLRLCESACVSLTTLLESIRLTIEDRPRKNDLVMLRDRIQELSFERANESLNTPKYHSFITEENYDEGDDETEHADYVNGANELHIYPNNIRTRADADRFRGNIPDRIIMHEGMLTGTISDYLFNDVLGPMVADGAVIVGHEDGDEETEIFGSTSNDYHYEPKTPTGDVLMTDIGTEAPDYPIDVLKDGLRLAVARLREASTRGDVTPYTLATIAGHIDTAVSEFDKEVGS